MILAEASWEVRKALRRLCDNPDRSSKFLGQGCSSGDEEEGIERGWMVRAYNRTFKCMLLFLKCDFWLSVLQQ